MAWKRPRKPDPLGQMPVPGYQTVPGRFYMPPGIQTGPQAPSGGFQSVIDTAPPLKRGALYQLMNTPQNKQSYKSGGGSASRRAMSGATANMTSNAIRSAADEFNQKSQQQSEKSRAEDVLAQRQTAQDRWQMDIFRDLFRRGTEIRLEEGYKDLEQYAVEEQKNASARFWSSFLGSLGGLL